MPVKKTVTREEALVILRDCEQRNGGYLTNHAYLGFKAGPANATLYKIFNCKPPTWECLCEITGINPSFAATLPDVLSEADILRLIDMGNSKMQMVPVPQRQQIALYCMRRVYPLVSQHFMNEDAYNRTAHANLLFGGWFCRQAFGTWNAALKAAGFPVNAARMRPHRTPRGKSADKEAGVIRCNEADLAGGEPVAPDWQLQPVDLAVSRVTEVTQLFVMANGLGLKHSETRMVLR